MICCACDKDLASCVCPDLKERLEKILQCKQIHIGEEYRLRIAAQAERNKSETSKAE